LPVFVKKRGKSLPHPSLDFYIKKGKRRISSRDPCRFKALAGRIEHYLNNAQKGRRDKKLKKMIKFVILCKTKK